jgi:hypothetical protein
VRCRTGPHPGLQERRGRRTRARRRRRGASRVDAAMAEMS